MSVQASPEVYNTTCAVLASVPFTGRKPVRFDSFGFRSCWSNHRFGSVRFGNVLFRFDVVRPAVLERVTFRPVPKLSGSFRFGSAVSVRLIIPSCIQRLPARDELMADRGRRMSCRHLQSYISKGMWRQGTGSLVGNSYVSTLCPVVIYALTCAFLTSGYQVRRLASRRSGCWHGSVSETGIWLLSEGHIVGDTA